jgi:phosphoglycolate phosphatase
MRTVPQVFLRAVVCDLDGTLVDSAPAIVDALRAACEAVGQPVPASADLTFGVGPPLEETLETLLGSADLIPAAVAAFRAHYRANLAAATAVMPGAERALTRFRTAGLALAVATYKSTELADAVLRATGLRSHFGTIIGRAPDGDTRPKSELVLHAMRGMGARPQETVYVGDHPDDEVAARIAGTRFIRFGPMDWAAVEGAVLASVGAARAGSTAATSAEPAAQA